MWRSGGAGCTRSGRPRRSWWPSRWPARFWLECPELRRRLPVVLNNLAFVRDGRLVVSCQQRAESGRTGPPVRSDPGWLSPPARLDYGALTLGAVGAASVGDHLAVRDYLRECDRTAQPTGDRNDF
jgi:hypothetical protein